MLKWPRSRSTKFLHLADPTKIKAPFFLSPVTVWDCVHVQIQKKVKFKQIRVTLIYIQEVFNGVKVGGLLVQ